MNGQYGVAQFLQDGASCLEATGTEDNVGVIAFLCNPSATTPFISSITQTEACVYEAIIQTAVVCPQVPSLGFSTSVGSSIISQQCGGGIYDLTQLNLQDIQGYIPGGVGSSYYYAIRVCGAVTSTTLCNSPYYQNVSVCQYYGGAGYVVAQYTPSLIPVFYQYLAPGVLSQVIQDGQVACTDTARLSNITFTCNPNATTAIVTSGVEYSPATISCWCRPVQCVGQRLPPSQHSAARRPVRLSFEVAAPPLPLCLRMLRSLVVCRLPV